MAEALARRRFGEAVKASSAGLRPQRPVDATNAVETLKAEFGLDVSDHVPRSVREVDLTTFDYVVAMDKFDRQAPYWRFQGQAYRLEDR